VKYSELSVWQKAMDLVAETYRLAPLLPADERFGLVAQMQRAAVSIPSNIAEGHGRKSTGAYLNHLSIASGSLAELETQAHIALRLNHVKHEHVEPSLTQADEVGRMLSGLRSSLNPKS
jgi:four helix bundle protein